MSYSERELDTFETLFESAAQVLNEDVYFSFILTMDPDQEIERALCARQDASEAARRSSLTDEQREAEDVDVRRGVERAMVREVLARKRACRLASEVTCG
jgi:hypothetical protein